MKIDIKFPLPMAWTWHRGWIQVQLLISLTWAIHDGKGWTLHTGCFTHSQEPFYPMNRKLVGAQSHPGQEEVKNFLSLLRFQPACGRFTILCYAGSQSVLHTKNQLQALRYSTHTHLHRNKICRYVTF